VVHLTGGVFLEAAFTAPWSVLAQVRSEDCYPTMTQPAAIVCFHYVVDGRMVLQVGEAAPIEVGAGAIIMLPHNDTHTLASAPGLPPMNAHHLIQLQREGVLGRIDYGGGGAATLIICGFIGSEARRHPLVEALPRVLTLDLNGRREADWIASSFRFAAQEVAADRPGSATVLAKLSELMFVEAVREYVTRFPAKQQSWLAGLRDPAIGRALALIHSQPARPWTAETLATEALLSRSAFAERFTQLVGSSPIAYLTAWRMQVAAQGLRESRRSIAQIAASVGYESEATFTRAFKREMGTAPGRYRCLA